MYTWLQMSSWLPINEKTVDFLVTLGIKLGLFTLAFFLSLVLGKFIPRLLKLLVQRFLPQPVVKIYLNLFETLERNLTITGTFLLFYVALDFLKEYNPLYGYIKLGIDLGVTFSFAFLCAGLFRNFLRIYGVNLIRQIGLEVEELLFILETVANALIGMLAVLGFAQSQNINLVGVLAGLGIGGLAVAFAAQSTLEQLVSTIVLYLDRPFRAGDYIRLSLSSQGIFLARVESIGLRSTKLRTLAKSTLVIVPNSKMANADIENVTRGKKIMVLLFMDFSRTLQKSEQAIIEQLVKESTNNIFGVDPHSTNLSFFPIKNAQGERVRVSLFVFDAPDKSQEFRRQLVIIMNEFMSKQLVKYGLEFTMKEPTVYVESNIPI